MNKQRPLKSILSVVNKFTYAYVLQEEQFLISNI